MTLPDLSSNQWALAVSELLDTETDFLYLFSKPIVLVEVTCAECGTTWQAAGWMYQEVDAGFARAIVDSNFISLARSTVCYWQKTNQAYFLRYVPVHWTRPQVVNVWEWQG